MNVLVTGSRGFIGRNLLIHLGRQAGVHVIGFDVENTAQELLGALAKADFVFHLAGVNRPKTEEEFVRGNVDLTETVCDHLLSLGRSVPLVLASSIQAELDNPYGKSKRQAEDLVSRYAETAGARGVIYRFKNVFGKWCRPNYNSVVATFCHNIARDLPITISDPNHMLELIHIDDVVRHLWEETQKAEPSGVYLRDVTPVHHITLGRLAERLRSFRQMREILILPDLGDALTRKLYGTYLSYLETGDFAYDLQQRCDPRGCLAEFLKSPAAGQIFVSSTKPGVTRGNHYHDTKTEKFLVIQGEAVIRFRHIESGEVLAYPVRGEDFRVIDIPPGYTHSIENTGTTDLITLFWASEVFDSDRPDTVYADVQVD